VPPKKKKKKSDIFNFIFRGKVIDACDFKKVKRGQISKSRVKSKFSLN
jgi:hypothetical protein